MLCKLCLTDKPLIQAHIIPKAFFKVYQSDRGVPKVLSNTNGVYPKRAPVGFYDPHILCGPCDNKIGVWDQYASDLFLRGLNTLTPFPDGEQAVAFVKPEYDFHRLRLFLLSVLWRADISSLPMFKKVQLGPYSARCRDLILEESVGDPGEFRTVLSAFTVKGTLYRSGVPIQDPFQERWNGAIAYRVSLGTVTAYIKVDRKPFPDAFERLALEEGRPLFLLQRDFETSQEAKVARAVVRAPHNRSAFRKPE